MLRSSLVLAVAFAVGSSTPVFARSEHSHGRAEGSNPPGWTHGEKKGWGDADMPPGLEKKAAETEKHKGKRKGKKKIEKDND